MMLRSATFSRYTNLVFTLSTAGLLVMAGDGCAEQAAEPKDAQTAVDTSDGTGDGTPDQDANNINDIRDIPETATACPDGTHRVNERCEADLVWRETHTLDHGRDHHGTVIAVVDGAPYLVVIGGWDGADFVDSVVVGTIGDDGDLGPTDIPADLPYGADGFGAAAIGNTIVLTGGMRKDPTHRIVASTLIGTVTAEAITWTEGDALPSPVFHSSLASSEHHFLLSGGYDGADSVNHVVVATRSDDGSVGPWTATTPLPRKMSHHSSFVHDGHLYVLGGLTGNAAGNHRNHTDVWRAPMDAAGMLGEWEMLTSLPRALIAHASAVFGGFVWNFGGVAQSPGGPERFVDEITRARLLADGTLGPWEVYPATLPVGRAHTHQTPIWGRFIYSVGGRTAVAGGQRFIWTGTFN